MKKRIIEAGHYYSAHGPTDLSLLGVKIAKQVTTTEDVLCLFIDDHHKNPPQNELSVPVADLDHKFFSLILHESNMLTPAYQLLEHLCSLPKKKRAEKSKNGQYFCSGFAITTVDGVPLCVLLDAALTQIKHQMGFDEIINILPYHYEEEQKNLFRLLAKILPDGVKVTSLLFNEKGDIVQTLTLR